MRFWLAMLMGLSGTLFWDCHPEVAGPNRPPVPVAGPDRFVLVGRVADLDGAASYDPDGDRLSYRWTLLAAPPGSQAGISSEHTRLSGLTPDRPGLYLVALEVDDGHLASARDLLQVMARAACAGDGECDDGDPCTRDRCVWGECLNQPVSGCVDECPDDPHKLEPGLCGCGFPEDDADGDGMPDCVDGCPGDPGKTEAGHCGCGNPDTDRDGDGALDCLEECPDDPDKLGAGVCGCGNPDIDTDSDGLLDCQDPCPQDVSGDTDGDGFCDSDDCAPLNPHVHPGASDLCNRVDDDCNGVIDDGPCPAGCADGQREGFVDLDSHPNIAGCSGGWSLAGVLNTTYTACGHHAGDDSSNPQGAGCGVADLCQPGWRVCASSADVAASSPTGCSGATRDGDAGLFFATRQSGSGSRSCDANGANDVFGCGNYGNGVTESCSPLDQSSGNLCAQIGDPWSCGTDSTDEANQVIKAAPDQGGVLCCRTEEDCSTDPDMDGDAWPDGCDPCPGDPDNDIDGDGFCASRDSCPQVYNPGQVDADGDGRGDACDDDDDGDGVLDLDDCAPLNPNMHPGAQEVCNGVDDDCDGWIDPGACPCPVENRDGHAYMLCAEPMDWPDAREACYQYGYTLAAIGDEEEDSWLWSLISEQLDGVETWHGFNDRSTEGQWSWENGSETVYTNWAPNEPNDATLFGEDCGSWQTAQAGQWNDRDCDDSLAYVCESGCGGTPDSDRDGWADPCDCAPYNPGVFPGAPEVCNARDDDCDGQIEPRSACPCGVEDYQGHRYLFCSGELGWQDARLACRQTGFSLLTVDDSSEGSWSRGRISAHIGSRPVWLGYNDRLSEGAWRWENGSRSLYTYWYAGQPDHQQAGDDCAMVESANSYWEDVDCLNPLPYVCESDPCPNDPENDIDGDGVCGQADSCPLINNPGQTGPCR